MQIRVLDALDVAAYRALRLRALTEDSTAFGSSASEFEGRPLEDLAGQLTPTEGRFTLGAFEAGQLLGNATLARETGRKNRHKAGIFGMHVAPEARGRGIARALMLELIERARQMDGLEVLNLSVAAPQAAARALYARLGFVQYGFEPRALIVDGAGVNEAHLRLVLREQA